MNVTAIILLLCVLGTYEKGLTDGLYNTVWIHVRWPVRERVGLMSEKVRGRRRWGGGGEGW